MPEAESPDDAALEPLLRGFAERARPVLARFRIPFQDAEDLLQETLLAFVLKRRDIHTPEAWLLGTLRHRCLVYHRRRRRRLYDAVDTSILQEFRDAGADGRERADLRADLRRATRGISRRCRTILRLRYEAGCTPREAADRLGCRRWAVYKALERCLAALSRRLIATGFKDGKAHA